MTNIIRLFEFLRIACAGTGFFMAYQSASSHPLFWITTLVVIPLSGLTALESLSFKQLSAQAKQRESGSDYQTQSALNNLATALTAALVLVLHLGTQAQLTIILSSLLFFTLSSIKHAHEYLINKKNSIHAQRFILSGLVVGASLPLILPYL